MIENTMHRVRGAMQGWFNGPPAAGIAAALTTGIIAALTADIAAALTHFKRLRRLSLDHNRLNDGGVRALEQALQRSTALEEVYVAFNPASKEAIRRVEEYFYHDGEAQAPAAQGACEKISLSIRESGGCVCQ